MTWFASQFWILPPPFNMIVIVTAIAFGVSLLGHAISQARKYMDRQADRQFKLDLIERGLSIEEAERWAQSDMSGKKK